MKYFRSQHGFTFVELLVSMSIIGLLATMGMGFYLTSQKRARDAKRRGDIKAMQVAFEQYFGENTTYETGGEAGCLAMADSMPAGLPRDLKEPVMTYTYDCNDIDSYCICADLELDNGNSNDNCANFGTGDTHYCLVNLQ